METYPQINQCIRRQICDGSVGIVRILSLMFKDDDNFIRIYKIKVLWVSNILKDSIRKGEIETCFVMDLKENDISNSIFNWRGR